MNGPGHEKLHVRVQGGEIVLCVPGRMEVFIAPLVARALFHDGLNACDELLPRETFPSAPQVVDGEPS